MAFSAGDILLVPFPYRDQPGERTRPAVVISSLSNNQRGDLVIAAITSHAPRDATDYALQDWFGAGLKLPSTVRMLFATIAESRVVFHVGHMSDRDWTEVKARVLQVFAWP
ncbi:MAG TPA: type II toxin-antitoxin system PemK/MazF family toxin [Gemmataceae bacterium]